LYATTVTALKQSQDYFVQRTAFFYDNVNREWGIENVKKLLSNKYDQYNKPLRITGVKLVLVDRIKSFDKTVSGYLHQPLGEAESRKMEGLMHDMITLREQLDEVISRVGNISINRMLLRQLAANVDCDNDSMDACLQLFRKREDTITLVNQGGTFKQSVYISGTIAEQVMKIEIALISQLFTINGIISVEYIY
jgi:hypothetical protein